MTIEKQTLLTGIFEGVLKIYKSSLWHEMKLNEMKELDKMQVLTAKQEYEYKKAVKQTEKFYNDKIKRTEKYNTEILDLINERTNAAPIIDSSIDLYTRFTEVLLEVINNTNKGETNLIPCLLQESKSGKLFIDGKQYEIHK